MPLAPVSRPPWPGSMTMAGTRVSAAGGACPMAGSEAARRTATARAARRLDGKRDARFNFGVGGGGGNRTRVRKHSTAGAYMLSLFPFLAARLPKRQGTERPAPKAFRSPASGPNRLAIPPRRRSGNPAGEDLRNGVPFYQAATAMGSAVNCFHRFYEVGGTSACHLCLTTSVETSSPPYSFRGILYGRQGGVSNGRGKKGSNLPFAAKGRFDPFLKSGRGRRPAAARDSRDSAVN